VLRYPGGRERRIRYPVPAAEPEEEEEESADSGEDVWESNWAACAWGPWGCALPGTDAGAEGSPGNQAPQAAAAADPAAVPQESPPERSLDQSKRFFDDLWELDSAPAAGGEGSQAPDLPSSPAELLRHVTSDEYQAAQAEEWARVRDSYQVLTTCPWVAPRPLFCLALARPEDAGAPHSSYTLRTRVEVEGASAELDKVFRKSKPGIGSKFQVDKLTDGLVAFGTPGAAEAFARSLEEEARAAVTVAEVDSHETFRMVQDVAGVVVLMRDDAPALPAPHRLRSALLGKTSLDD